MWDQHCEGNTHIHVSMVLLVPSTVFPLVSLPSTELKTLQCSDGISTVVLNILNSTDGILPPQHWWYPSTVLKILHITKCYPSKVLMTFPSRT